MEVSGSEKRSSLMQHGIIYQDEKFNRRNDERKADNVVSYCFTHQSLKTSEQCYKTCYECNLRP